jgi:2,3,4,5-tetrahydropyridine-2,6-dicarboxylate N-succinyltransferase
VTDTLAIIDALDRGEIRVAEKVDGEWQVNEPAKAAILDYFRISKVEPIEVGPYQYMDKIPLKRNYAELGVRVVPPATARYGSFLSPGVVLMPSYVNIGAHVGSGTMVDTWATVGSCAQIGRNVHLSGGVGIGGVLEPLQASPTIIEDDCFIGARSEVVEGVVVEAGSVISMGVYLGQSTRIYDRTTGKILQGRVPAGSVVVSGTLPSSDGKYGLYCAVIVKRVDAQTRSKTSINDLLRIVD